MVKLALFLFHLVVASLVGWLILGAIMSLPRGLIALAI